MEVKHFIACAESRRLSPLEPSRFDLSAVGYSFRVEPGFAFPLAIAKVCLFTRFYRAFGSQQFAIRIGWENPHGDTMLLRKIKSIPIEFAESVRDVVFAVYDLEVPDVGLVECRLTTLDAPRTILAAEYLEVRER